MFCIFKLLFTFILHSGWAQLEKLKLNEVPGYYPISVYAIREGCAEYLEVESSECLPCSENCLECTIDSNGAQKCSSCIDDYYLAVDKKSCLKCPEMCPECYTNVNWLTNALFCSNVSTGSKDYYQISPAQNSVYVKCPENCTTCYYSNLTKNASNFGSAWSTYRAYSKEEILLYNIQLRCSGCLSTHNLNFFGSCTECEDVCLGCTNMYRDNETQELVALEITNIFFSFPDDSIEELNIRAESYFSVCKACKGSSFVNSTTGLCQKCPKSCSKCLEDGNVARCTECKTSNMGFHYDGSCFNCSTNCTSCFYAAQSPGNPPTENYTQSNTFKLLTAAEATTLGLKKLCGSCNTNYTIDIDFSTCIACPSYCIECYYTNNKDIYLKQLYQSRPPIPTTKAELSQKGVSLKCSNCIENYSISLDNLCVNVLCKLNFCSVCQFQQTQSIPKVNYSSCLLCRSGYLSYRFQNQSVQPPTQITLCKKCSDFFDNCVSCQNSEPGAGGGGGGGGGGTIGGSAAGGGGAPSNTGPQVQYTCNSCEAGSILVSTNTLNPCQTCANCMAGMCIADSSLNEAVCQECMSPPAYTYSSEYQTCLLIFDKIWESPEKYQASLYSLSGTCTECHFFCKACIYNNSVGSVISNFYKSKCLRCKDGAKYSQDLNTCIVCPNNWDSCSYSGSLDLYIDCSGADPKNESVRRGTSKDNPFQGIKELSQYWNDEIFSSIDSGIELFNLEEFNLTIFFLSNSQCLFPQQDFLSFVYLNLKGTRNIQLQTRFNLKLTTYSNTEDIFSPDSSNVIIILSNGEYELSSVNMNEVLIENIVLNSSEQNKLSINVNNSKSLVIRNAKILNCDLKINVLFTGSAELINISMIVSNFDINSQMVFMQSVNSVVVENFSFSKTVIDTIFSFQTILSLKMISISVTNSRLKQIVLAEFSSSDNNPVELFLKDFEILENLFIFTLPPIYISWFPLIQLKNITVKNNLILSNDYSTLENNVFLVLDDPNLDMGIILESIYFFDNNFVGTTLILIKNRNYLSAISIKNFLTNNNIFQGQLGEYTKENSPYSIFLFQLLDGYVVTNYIDGFHFSNNIVNATFLRFFLFTSAKQFALSNVELKNNSQDFINFFWISDIKFVNVSNMTFVGKGEAFPLTTEFMYFENCFYLNFSNLHISNISLNQVNFILIDCFDYIKGSYSFVLEKSVFSFSKTKPFESFNNQLKSSLLSLYYIYSVDIMLENNFLSNLYLNSGDIYITSTKSASFASVVAALGTISMNFNTITNCNKTFYLECFSGELKSNVFSNTKFDKSNFKNLQSNFISISLRGGAINAKFSITSFINNTFNEISSGLGSPIHLMVNSIDNKSFVIFNACQFLNNQAFINGILIIDLKKSPIGYFTVIMEDIKFKYNQVGISGIPFTGDRAFEFGIIFIDMNERVNLNISLAKLDICDNYIDSTQSGFIASNKFQFLNLNCSQIHFFSENSVPSEQFFYRLSYITFKFTLNSSVFENFSFSTSDFFSVLSSASTDTYILINSTKFINISIWNLDVDSPKAFLVFRDLSALTVNYSSFSNINLNNQAQSNYTAILKGELINFIMLKNNLFLAITNSLFDLIQCLKCQAMAYFETNSIAHINNSLFQNNYGDFFGTIYINGSTSLSIFSGSQFYNNTAKKSGGAIALTVGSNVLIYDSLFDTNKCNEGEGGAIFFFMGFNSIRSSDLKFIIWKTSFKTNYISANKSAPGQAISSIAHPIKYMEGNKFLFFYESSPSEERIALKDIPDNMLLFFSNESSANISQYNSTNELIIAGHKSGYNISGSIKIILRDQYFNELKYDDFNDSMLIEMKLVDSNNSVNYTKVTFINEKIESSFAPFNTVYQAFILPNINIIGDRNSKMRIQLSAKTLIGISGANLTRFDSKPSTPFVDSLNITINIKDCDIGEWYDNIGNDCKLCPQFEYSLKNYDACRQCPDNAYCPGGKKLILNSGYWRISEESDVIIECHNAKDNCPGGKGYECIEGSVGPRCEECDLKIEVWPERYTKATKFSCGKCSDVSTNALKILLVSMITLITLTISVRSTVSLMEKILKMRLISIFSKKKSAIETGDLGAVYIKIFANYFQIVSSISTFHIELPSQATNVPEFVGSPIQQVFYSTDCFLASSISESFLPVIYSKLLYIMMTPLIYLIIFLIIYKLYEFSLKLNSKKQSVVIIACLFMFLYLQPNIIDYCISLLSCVEIGSGNFKNFYIKANLNNLCYTHDYNYYSLVLVFPIFFFFTVFFPIGILLILISKRHALNFPINRVYYGFLYNEYSPKAYYWEFVKMYQRIFILLFLNFFENDVPVKAFLVMTVITVYTTLSHFRRPYNSSDLNRFDKTSSAVCFFSILLALLIYKNKFPFFVWIILILIFIINIVFLFNICLRIVNSMLGKLEEIIDIFRKKKLCLCLVHLSEKFFGKPDVDMELRVNKNWDRVRKVVKRMQLLNLAKNCNQKILFKRKTNGMAAAVKTKVAMKRFSRKSIKNKARPSKISSLNSSPGKEDAKSNDFSSNRKSLFSKEGGTNAGSPRKNV